MKDTFFLFASIKFDRKKFAKDFERFKENKENKDVGSKVSIVGNTKSKQEEGDKSSKKSKQKGVVGGLIEGFRVFKSSNSNFEIEQNDLAKDKSSEKRRFSDNLSGIIF